MKKVISILLISNLAFSQTATLDTNTILIGEQIKLTITNHINKTKNWPNYSELTTKGIEIINTSKIDTINKLIKQEFIITVWDTGDYYIPAFSFSDNSTTQELLINVQPVQLKEDAKLKDIKQPIKEPIGWSDIWPWIIGIIIMGSIIYLLKKYIFTKKEKIIKPKITIPPHIKALKQLSKLENKKIWQKGHVKEYQSQLSEIIRRYTENRFNFIALEMTTDEILQELQTILRNEQSNNLAILLQRSDLAKFAKSEPIDTENIESMKLAKEFINSTKETKENE